MPKLVTPHPELNYLDNIKRFSCESIYFILVLCTFAVKVRPHTQGYLTQIFPSFSNPIVKLVNLDFNR